MNDSQIEENKDVNISDAPYDDLGNDMQQMGQNINLQHLLRATNHLKIAQNEFEKAKKQLQAKGINVFGKANELPKDGISS